MRVGLVCLDPVIGDGIAGLLSRTGGFDVVFNAGHLAKLTQIIESQKPDLLIFTEDFADPDSRTLIRQMRDANQVATMLLHAQNRAALGADLEFDVLQSRWAGTGALCDAIRGLDRSGGAANVTEAPPAPRVADESVLRKLAKLSKNERATAHFVAKAMSNKEIAEQLGLKDPTIKLYVGRLLRLFDCKSRVQLALALRAVDPES